MRRRMSRKRLTRELAERTDLTQDQAASVLTALVAIAYREANSGFTIPDLCTLRVVERKPRRCRNPRTGEMLEIGAHSVLKIRPSQKARRTVTPRPAGLVAKAEPPIIASPDARSMPQPISFIPLVCPQCRQEIEASSDLAGTTAECPSCGCRIEIPPIGTPPVSLEPMLAAERGPDPATRGAMNKRTIRIELPEDLRSTA